MIWVLQKKLALRHETNKNIAVLNMCDLRSCLSTSEPDMVIYKLEQKVMAMQDNGQENLAFVASFVIFCTIDILCVFSVLYSTRNSNKNTIFRIQFQ